MLVSLGRIFILSIEEWNFKFFYYVGNKAAKHFWCKNLHNMSKDEMQ